MTLRFLFNVLILSFGFLTSMADAGLKKELHSKKQYFLELMAFDYVDKNTLLSNQLNSYIDPIPKSDYYLLEF